MKKVNFIISLTVTNINVNMTIFHSGIELRTVNLERFAGLNFRGFNPMKFSRETFTVLYV